MVISGHLQVISGHLQVFVPLLLLKLMELSPFTKVVSVQTCIQCFYSPQELGDIRPNSFLHLLGSALASGLLKD